jgi:hypothetical protein
MSLHVRDVAPPYDPLMTRIEKYVAPSKGNGADPTRVAMLVSKRYAEQSIADSLTALMRFNGKTVVENGSNFLAISVPALADEPTADYSATNAQLLAFRPHIVVAITREEFVHKIYPALESGWGSSSGGQHRPFYVVPTSLSGNTDMLTRWAEHRTGDQRRQPKAHRRCGAGIRRGFDAVQSIPFAFPECLPPVSESWRI